MISMRREFGKIADFQLLENDEKLLIKVLK